MSNIILYTTKTYINNFKKQVTVQYKLTKRLSMSISPPCSVYDISCERLSKSTGNPQYEIFTGVTDNRATAEKIFAVIADNVVLPEHLIDVIDDLCDEF